MNKALLGSLFLALKNHVAIDSFNSFNGSWGLRCPECPNGVNIGVAGDVQSGGAATLDRSVTIRGTVQANTRSDTPAVPLPDGAKNLGSFSLGRDESIVLTDGDYVADTFSMTGYSRLPAAPCAFGSEEP